MSRTCSNDLYQNRDSKKKHPNTKINKNDLVIFSSREIPGNEKKINFLKEKILKKECEYLDHRMQKVHVSGHPSKQELKKIKETSDYCLLKIAFCFTRGLMIILFNEMTF